MENIFYACNQKYTSEIQIIYSITDVNTVLAKMMFCITSIFLYFKYTYEKFSPKSGESTYLNTIDLERT
jgi:hypothetical protein